MDFAEVVMLLLVIAVIVCPPKYCPGIRLKEQNERKRRERNKE